MCYTTTTQTRGNLPFDTRAHTCLVSQNDKEKRKQKCYGLTSAREFLRKYAQRERLNVLEICSNHIKKVAKKLLYILSSFYDIQNV